MVTMCRARVAFRCAIIAAIDVLLPLPAAPTTSTIPFGLSASSWVTGKGNPSDSMDGISTGMIRMTTARLPR